MSIQRVSGSAVSSTIEANFALNHMNLDFSLVKIDAPTELRPLGNLLSKNRKSSAEEGPFHVLARRLGALFDDVLPDVPSLVTAYGKRASEIAESTDQATQKPKARSNGPFSGYFGIDSTTIWAAATSSKSAIRIHLIACMLARVWTPQEATAIWVDLIMHRQAQIKRNAEDEGIATNSMAYAAALHKLDQSTIAEWDASARSWMEVADKARSRQQKQIQLILDNLSVPVKDLTRQEVGHASQASQTRATLYKNVISNVCEALSALNNLVEGMSQRVSAGGILLALMSWHIYPDLVILDRKAIDVYQKDDLVACSGVATIAIQFQEEHFSGSSEALSIHSQSRDSGVLRKPNNKGVYWSVALSSLRYYGTVERSRSTAYDMKRLTIPQLQLLALGAILDRESLSSLPQYIQMIEQIRNVSMQTLERGAADLILEVEAARRLKEEGSSSLFHGHSGEKVKQFSRDDAKSSIMSAPMLLTLRMLSAFTSGIEILHSEDFQERQMAQKLVSYSARHGKKWMSNTDPDSIPRLFGLAEVRSLVYTMNQKQRISLLRKLCELRNISQASAIISYAKNPGHWAYTSTNQKGNYGQNRRKRKREESEVDSSEEDPHEIKAPADENWIFLHKGMTRSYQRDEPSGYLADAIESENWFEDSSFCSLVQEPPDTMQKIVFYDFLFGDPATAAVYMRREQSDGQAMEDKDWQYAPLDLVLALLKDGTIQMDYATNTMAKAVSAKTAPRDSIFLLGKISQYYLDHLPEATVNIELIKTPMVSWKWSHGLLAKSDAFSGTAEDSFVETFAHLISLTEKEATLTQILFRTIPIARMQVFAMILQLNSGYSERDLKNVMALSQGNSLYVAKRLVDDPIDVGDEPEYLVEHIVGNIGKPGIALMFTSEALNMRQHSIDEWHFSNHARFDRERALGIFDATPLHLSFTGYEEPLPSELSGLRGHDAIFVETIISMEDRGKWIADIDILKAFENSRKVYRFEKYDGSCGHQDPSFTHHDLDMISIDSWEELIDPSESIMVVRAGTSWMARVAAVSIASSKSYTCCYCPSDGNFCWQCLLKGAQNGYEDLSRLHGRGDIVLVY